VSRRLLFIDNIRWTMIILVLSMHACDTYSPFGNWYYTDRPPLSLVERIGFATYQSWLQAFFMALLFFVAAYFTPASYERSGAVRYVHDRFTRLIVPTLLYVFIVGPVTEYYLSRTWTGGGGFGRQWVEHLIDGEWLSGTGPMWFCVVLFAFSATYACLRSAGAPFWKTPFVVAERPSIAGSLAFVVLMAAAGFIVRVFSPSGRSVLNVHFADVPQYALMFAVGIVASRGGWLERPLAPAMLRTSVGLLAVSVAIWAAIVAWVLTQPESADELNGGLNLLSALKCLWESLVCVGVSYLLMDLYRRRFDRQGPVARFLSRNAFAVYLFHPPIIIAGAILLHEIALPGPWKALLLTLLAGLATFSLSSLVFRRIPYLRAVL
jgi:glucan biosynthesis protein C